MLITRAPRWNLIEKEDFKNDFDQVTFFPLVIYSLKPKWLFNLIRTVVAIRRIKFDSDDIFFAIGPGSFIGCCCLSFHKKVFRIGLISESNFESNYRFNYPLKKEDYQMRWPSVFFYKFVEPLLGLYPGIRRLERPGGRGAYAISRFLGLLNEIFDITYILQAK